MTNYDNFLIVEDIENPASFINLIQGVKHHECLICKRRFKRGCEKAGILTETRRREFYEKPTAMRKRKLAAATKRHKRKVSMTAIRKKPPYKKF